MAEDIIQKIKQSGLTGRSGSSFPTWQKWQAVKSALGSAKYVICNASEGEPKVHKDRHILEYWPDRVVDGMKIALKTVGAKTGYIYLNPDYYPILKPVLSKLIWNLPIEIFKKPDGYLMGEETVLLNVIEGKKAEPRIRPPYPTTSGLYGKPTLINNVETLYAVSQIAKNEYENNRFVSIYKASENKGVFEVPEKASIRKILEQTDNLPNFNFFVQVGGGASGTVFLSDQLNQPIKGTGSIVIYDYKSTNPLLLMQKWTKFFMKNNCDKCTPCREGVYRINDILKNKKTISKVANPEDLQTLKEIFFVLENTSLCPVGKMVTFPLKSAIAKLL